MADDFLASERPHEHWGIRRGGADEMLAGDCEFDAIHDGGICWYCTGEACAHFDCVGKLGHPDFVCDHDCSERHPAPSPADPTGEVET